MDTCIFINGRLTWVYMISSLSSWIFTNIQIHEFKLRCISITHCYKIIWNHKLYLCWIRKKYHFRCIVLIKIPTFITMIITFIHFFSPLFKHSFKNLTLYLLLFNQSKFTLLKNLNNWDLNQIASSIILWTESWYI